MPKLKALHNINHDGKTYAPGKLLEVDDDQAAPLLAVGAAELFSSKKAQAEADKAQAEADKAQAEADKAQADAGKAAA